MTVEDLARVINELLPEPHAGLLSGITFGTKASLAPALYDQLVTTGTLHIVALSGFNITILTSIVNVTLLPILGRRWSSLVTIGIIAGFIQFVGPSPSIVRAGIMGSVALLSVVFGRQQWALLSWIIAAGVMLLVDLSLIGNISFQLSIAASLGIILFSRSSGMVLKDEKAVRIGQDGGKNGAIQRRSASLLYYTSPIASFLRDDLRVTLAAQVFTTPLVFVHFQRISLISPVSNILIGWAIGPVTILGICAAIGGYVFPLVGKIIAVIAWVFLEYILKSIELTAQIPFASVGG